LFRSQRFIFTLAPPLQAAESIEAYDRGELELRPGCDMLQSLEEILNGLLGRLRESAGQAAMKALPWSNSPRIMADCGSKGSPLNISQMIAIVGQQAVGGKRIENGFVDRTLPHFEHNSLTPSAKGFVANSFYSGLTATEFFFHAMGGREGLVDTAVKTAETGYMARRLMKALEDLSLQYDNSVRNSENTVVQFIYGDDGLNPQSMEDNDRPVDFHRVHRYVSEMHPCNDEAGFTSIELIDKVKAALSEERFQSLPTGTVFLQNIREYFEGLADQWNTLAAENTAGPTSMNIRAWNSCRFSPTQLDQFLEIALDKCKIAYVEPGEACGAIGAQSISEPGTQMTLKVSASTSLLLF
jgi:DNA-directed RNA polymerase III subunit RPC1